MNRPKTLNDISMAMKYAEKFKSLSDDELENVLIKIGVSSGIKRYVYKFRRRNDIRR